MMDRTVVWQLSFWVCMFSPHVWGFSLGSPEIIHRDIHRRLTGDSVSLVPIGVNVIMTVQLCGPMID